MYQTIIKSYKLNKNTNLKQLEKAGFRYTSLHRNIYGKQIQLVLDVDLDENSWNYGVYHIGTKSKYFPYYNREYGINKVNDQLDKRIKEECERLCNLHILTRRRKRNGKNVIRRKSSSKTN